MTDRKVIYDSLKLKMEDVGFQFDKEQKPHLQNRKETELKFIHPELIEKLKQVKSEAISCKFCANKKRAANFLFTTL